MKDILKIVKSLEDSGMLLGRVSQTIQNEAKEGVIRAGEGTTKVGYGSEKSSFKKRF